MKRVVTITMDIDKSTHTMIMDFDVQEDGKKKKRWTQAEAISTSRAMIEAADNLLTKLIEMETSASEGGKQTEGISGNLEEIPSIDKDQLARSAASEWCRCFKCDGIVNETQLPCWKPGATCLKWCDAYKAVRIALDKVKVAPGVEVKITEGR